MVLLDVSNSYDVNGFDNDAGGNLTTTTRKVLGRWEKGGRHGVGWR